jgi:hypothetical protein
MTFKSLLTAAVLLPVTAGAASAQWSQKLFDSYCRVGTIRTCASVHVYTMWDAVANRTRVELWLRNLEGTLPQDNTGGAPIGQLGLTSPFIRGASNLTVTAVGGATVVGNPYQFWTMSQQQIEGPVTLSTNVSNTFPYNGSVLGCTMYPPQIQHYFQTCGTGWVRFGFTTTNQWDASIAEVAWRVKTTPDDIHYLACRTADKMGDTEYCENVDPTVTPEPVTVTLLGSGLAGLGAAFTRRRRRQKAEQNQA